MRYLRPLALLCAFLSAGALWSYTSTVYSPVAPLLLAPSVTEPHAMAEVTGTTTLWFLGDVMLSRQVGRFARERSPDYPWQRINGTFAEAYVIANFESCLSKTQTFSNEAQLRFPVDPSLVSSIQRAGVTHVSLANNHSLDCGPADYQYTKAAMASSGIVAFGHGVRTDSESVTYIEIGTSTVALIGIHTLFVSPDLSSLRTLLTQTDLKSDFQIVYIHWGNEYELVSSRAQQTLATELVAAGADLIVGHHPHVVQEIGLINGVPVVYSLGNFIFDQYFSVEVQRGLMLKLEWLPTPTLSLHPITSADSRTQPRSMTADERVEFLKSVALRSDPMLRSYVAVGVLPLHLLATSSKSAIIVQ